MNIQVWLIYTWFRGFEKAVVAWLIKKLLFTNVWRVKIYIFILAFLDFFFKLSQKTRTHKDLQIIRSVYIIKLIKNNPNVERVFVLNKSEQQ